jgi:cytoskeletal protein CcmA (bactofilin family)
MAIRNTKFVIKNNQNSAAPFSGATLLVGEPIVNTAAGIMMFSGVTTGTPDWTPAGTGGNAGFFEVGSNLYQLKIRDKITSYSGVTNLDGLFLSGTSNGFVLAQTKDLNTFSAFTYSANTFTIYESNGEINSVTVNDFTGLTINGNFTVTGNTNINNNLTVTGNTNIQSLTATTTIINGDLTVTGNTNVQALSATSIYVSGFVPTQVVYISPTGQLTGENAFTYDQDADTLNVNNIQVSNDVVVQGNLTVLGDSISAFTTNLYVEDPNIPINYNPTGSTTVTSVNAGFTIQDGSGVSGSSVNLNLVQMLSLTGLTPSNVPVLTEYVGLTGYPNRGWITQLNDIVIRSTDVSDSGSPGSINGVRVLAEFDVLDGGTY